MSQEVIQWNDSTEVQGHKEKNKKKRVKKYRLNEKKKKKKMDNN